jgi:hypothetical protein
MVYRDPFSNYLILSSWKWHTFSNTLSQVSWVYRSCIVHRGFQESWPYEAIDCSHDTVGPSLRSNNGWTDKYSAMVAFQCLVQGTNTYYLQDPEVQYLLFPASSALSSGVAMIFPGNELEAGWWIHSPKLCKLSHELPMRDPFEIRKSFTHGFIQIMWVK